MTETRNLERLRDRLAAEQRTILMQAADAGVMPPFNALARVADLEGGLAATDAVLDEDADEPLEETRRAPAPPAPPPPALPPASAQIQNARAGTVKWFNGTKGFGFIQSDTGGPDAFVHITAVERAGLSGLNEGQKLSYVMVTDTRSGKQSADDLKIIG